MTSHHMILPFITSGAYERLATLEFSRDRKSMSVLCRPRGAAPGAAANRLFVKVGLLSRVNKPM